MRQRGEDDDTQRLRQILEHLRNDNFSDADLEAVNSRTLYDLLPEERTVFDDAIYLCATNALVDNIN
jgi:hypothetical protein